MIMLKVVRFSSLIDCCELESFCNLLPSSRRIYFKVEESDEMNVVNFDLDSIILTVILFFAQALFSPHSSHAMTDLSNAWLHP